MSVIEALAVAGLTGAVSGLIAWGGIKVELKWLRRDVDAAHQRLDSIAAPSAYTAREQRHGSR